MADSSTFNKPPHTQQDYWVVNAFLLNAGLTSDSPDNGVHVLPERPSGYHHETRGPGIVIGNSACIAVMIIVTVTRLYLRWFSPRLNWGADDALMIPAVLMAIAYPALQISMVVYGGAGQHIYDITYHEYYIYHWLAAAAQIDFFVCVGLVKMSIAVFNMRLTGMATTRLWNIGNRPFFGIVLAYIIIAFFLNVFQCVPAITSFDYVAIGKSGVPPKCLGVQKMNTILRVINITMDYCLLTVPIIIVGSLQMSMKKKMRLAGIFAVGALACIGSVMTLVAKSKLKTDALCMYAQVSACEPSMLILPCRELYLAARLDARRACLRRHCRLSAHSSFLAPWRHALQRRLLCDCHQSSECHLQRSETEHIPGQIECFQAASGP